MATRKWKTAIDPIFTISKLPDHSVEGCLGETRFITEKENSFRPGEMVKLFAQDFVNPDTGEVTSVWLDGGLKGLLAMLKNKVTPETVLRIVWTGKEEVEDLGLVNQYKAEIGSLT